MGNSPSKNDPLPTASNPTQSTSATGELEQEDTSVQAALSRPHGSLSAFTDEGSPYSSTPAIRIEKKKNGSFRGSSTQSGSANGFVGPSRRLVDDGLALDLEIGVSMARLLSTGASSDNATAGTCVVTAASGLANARSASGTASVSSSPEYLLVRPNSLAINPYDSSLDSEKSNLASPVFTSSTDDLGLSVSSYSSQYHEEHHDSKLVGSPSDLDPIMERSLESTPTPTVERHLPKLKLVGYAPKSSSSSTVSSSSASSPLLSLSSDHTLNSLTSLGGSAKSPNRADAVVKSSSPKAGDFDVDSIIDKLLEIGLKKTHMSGTSKRKQQRDKLPMTASEIKFVLAKARSIFLDQPNLLRLSPPVKIVGDIHGQFFDLIRIFNSCGYPPYTNYLFLGDYVDRGYKSLETILLLLCYKIKYPENFFMLRGNHESANITKIYGFYDECKRRLPSIPGNSSKLWKSFIDVFNTLPIAATINDKIFCIHGGLSPDLLDLKQIDNIKRPTDIPDKGLLADLLWSDPDPLVRNFSLLHWPKNDRGVSYTFGKKHVDHFCSKFKIDLIVRGHMVVEDGYEFFNKRKLVTIFSAPNYCGEFDNFGAIMSVDRKLCCSFELLKPSK